MADIGAAVERLVKIMKRAENARNFSQCDSLLIGDKCAAHTVPYVDVKNPTAKVEHEATTSRIGEDQLFYCQQRGLSEEDAVSLIVNGFAKEVLKELPMEFAVEAQKLLGVSLEGAIGCVSRERRANVEDSGPARDGGWDAHPQGTQPRDSRWRGARHHGPQRRR